MKHRKISHLVVDCGFIRRKRKRLVPYAVHLQSVHARVEGPASGRDPDLTSFWVWENDDDSSRCSLLMKNLLGIFSEARSTYVRGLAVGCYLSREEMEWCERMKRKGEKKKTQSREGYLAERERDANRGAAISDNDYFRTRLESRRSISWLIRNFINDRLLGTSREREH